MYPSLNFWWNLAWDVANTAAGREGKAGETVPFPDIDVPSFILDGVPDNESLATNERLTRPIFISAENPGTTHLSLVQLKRLTRGFAAGLIKCGLQPGDVVMLVSPNYVNSMVVALGVMAAEGIYSAAQPDINTREYVDQMARDQPKFLLVANEDPIRERVLSAWAAVGGDAERCWLFDADALESGGPSAKPPHARWTQLIDDEGAKAYRWPRLTTAEECSRPCMLITTSGTSGLRKAAMFSHRNMVASWTAAGHRAMVDTIAAAIRARSAPSKTPRRYLHTISISRGMGTTFPLAITTSQLGAPSPVEVYFMAKAYSDMNPYLARIEALRISHIICAPFSLARLFVLTKSGIDAAGARFDFSALETVTCVGAPSSQSSLDGARAFLVAHGAPSTLRVERALGITESGSLVSSWRLADPLCNRDYYQGRVEPNMEVKIMVDEREAEPGEAGLIWLRSPSRIKGYYKDDESTKKAFRSDGWYITGDIGWLEEGNRLFLTDRDKDVLKTPDSIPPAYIEGVLLEHPAVADVGVIGIFKPEQGLQLVRAYVVTRAGAELGAKELAAWMEGQSTSTAWLTGGVKFVDKLPRNGFGKLQRRVLREWAKQEQDE